MTTKDMIRELRSISIKHKSKKLHTGELNISLMCSDVADRLEEYYELFSEVPAEDREDPAWDFDRRDRHD